MKLEAAIKEEQILRRSGGGVGGEATGNGTPIEPLRRLSCGAGGGVAYIPCMISVSAVEEETARWQQGSGLAG